jgi:aminopeptidase N
MSREFAFPGTRARYAPDRVVDLQHIALALDVDPARREVAGTATLTGVVLAPNTRVIELDAVELAIEHVTANGKRVEYRHDGKRVRIELEALDVGAQLTIAVEYRGAPRRGLYFIGPDEGYPDKPMQIWTQGQDEDSRYWFPCFDTPNQKATSELSVRVPANLFALSNGSLVSDRVDGGKRIIHWKLDVPHSCYLITLAVGDFAAIETRWRDVPVVYYVQRGREAEAERTLARTPQMLELFSKLFGVPYPYPRYSQVFVGDFIFGGMENTSATTLTDTVLIDERASLDYDIDSLVAHELAHQWFGDLVTCRDWGEGWLNEGFATYAEYLWREAYEGRDAADLELEDWADMYFGEDAGRYRRTIATKLYDEPIDIFDHHLYEKGGRVLHMLRHYLGDEPFFKALGYYLGKHKHGVVESRDLARAVEESTGKNLDWFFSQWVIDGAGHPELDVSIAYNTDTRLATVTVEQKQKVEGKTPLFRIPTKIRFHTRSGDLDIPLEIVDQRHVFHLRLDDEPTQAIFDPVASCSPRRRSTSPSRSGSPSCRGQRSASTAVPPRTHWRSVEDPPPNAPSPPPSIAIRTGPSAVPPRPRSPRCAAPPPAIASSPRSAASATRGPAARSCVRSAIFSTNPRSPTPSGRSSSTATPATSSRPRRAWRSGAFVRRAPASCCVSPPPASRSPT